MSRARAWAHRGRELTKAKQAGARAGPTHSASPLQRHSTPHHPPCALFLSCAPALCSSRIAIPTNSGATEAAPRPPPRRSPVAGAERNRSSARRAGPERPPASPAPAAQLARLVRFFLSLHPLLPCPRGLPLLLIPLLRSSVLLLHPAPLVLMPNTGGGLLFSCKIAAGAH